VDFEKAFDSVDKDIIWKPMHYYRIPSKFIRIIQKLYEEATYQVIHSGKLTSPFTVKTDVKQGCMLSPTHFLIIVIDWIMQQTSVDNNMGIQWTFTKQILLMMSICKLQNAKTKVSKFAKKAKNTNLKINRKKIGNKQQAARSNTTGRGKHQRN
jgi:hypothetical protein